LVADFPLKGLFKFAGPLLTQIFQPFYTTKPEVKGTGLGLSICHGIVQNHRGEILVESEPGKGSTFKVVLPIDAENYDQSSRVIFPATPENGSHDNGGEI
jgi:hypothetical protein